MAIHLFSKVAREAIRMPFLSRRNRLTTRQKNHLITLLCLCYNMVCLWPAQGRFIGPVWLKGGGKRNKGILIHFQRMGKMREIWRGVEFIRTVKRNAKEELDEEILELH